MSTREDIFWPEASEQGLNRLSEHSRKGAASYGRIAIHLRAHPWQIRFVSDVSAELDPARGAGMGTILSKRSGNAPEPNTGAHPVVESFDEIP